jgi:NTE family protein
MKSAVRQGDQTQIVLVLAGGVGLGAYQAGGYAALHKHCRTNSLWVAGSSIGAINAAVIAGNPPERRIERLRADTVLVRKRA